MHYCELDVSRVSGSDRPDLGAIAISIPATMSHRLPIAAPSPDATGSNLLDRTPAAARGDPGRLGGRPRPAGLPGRPDPPAALAGAGRDAGPRPPSCRWRSGPSWTPPSRFPGWPPTSCSCRPTAPGSISGGWRDGEAIESVLIPSGSRRTLCISSQAGCALRCSFCATGRMGFRRNLTAFEIAGQVREIVLRDPAEMPTNVVFMGMGEPLLNWPAVDTALTHPQRARGLRHRRPAHHRVDRRNPARHGGVRRAAGAVPPRHLAPCADVGPAPAASCRSRRSTISRRC